MTRSSPTCYSAVRLPDRHSAHSEYSEPHRPSLSTRRDRLGPLHPDPPLHHVPVARPAVTHPRGQFAGSRGRLLTRPQPDPTPRRSRPLGPDCRPAETLARRSTHTTRRSSHPKQLDSDSRLAHTHQSPATTIATATAENSVSPTPTVTAHQAHSHSSTHGTASSTPAASIHHIHHIRTGPNSPASAHRPTPNRTTTPTGRCGPTRIEATTGSRP
jgi:hypothetical protein